MWTYLYHYTPKKHLCKLSFSSKATASRAHSALLFVQASFYVMFGFFSSSFFLLAASYSFLCACLYLVVAQLLCSRCCWCWGQNFMREARGIWTLKLPNSCHILIEHRVKQCNYFHLWANHLNSWKNCWEKLIWALGAAGNVLVGVVSRGRGLKFVHLQFEIQSVVWHV